MPLSTRLSSKRCSRDLTRPLRRSSCVSNGASREDFHGPRGATGITVSPSRNMATERCWTLGSWSSRRSGASACTGHGPSRAHPRPSPSPKKLMDGTWPSPATLSRSTRRPQRARRQRSTWAWSRSLPWPTGSRFAHPAYYRKAEASLRRCQRRVSRRQKGSRRRRKAVMLLAKAHQHIARQRRDFHHKSARTVGASV